MPEYAIQSLPAQPLSVPTSVWSLCTRLCSRQLHPFAELFPSHRMEILTHFPSCPSTSCSCELNQNLTWMGSKQCLRQLFRPIHVVVCVRIPSHDLLETESHLRLNTIPVCEFWFCVYTHLLVGTWVLKLNASVKKWTGSYKYPFRPCFLSF